MVGEPNGLQYGSIKRPRSETAERPESQFKLLSRSGSASCATIGGSLNQAPVSDLDQSLRLLNKVDNRLRQLFPLMPMYLFRRTLSRQAQLVNELSRLKNEHAQHATLGTCPSGKHCSYRANVQEPAKQFPAIMECLVCFKTQFFQTRANWTDHLYADVKPYFCTAYPCRNTTQFSSKQDWLRHEKENCQKQYWKCDVGECTTMWDGRCDVGECTTMWVDQTDFKTHLVEEHSLPEDDKLDSIQQRCGHNSYRTKETCLFCGVRGHDDLDTHVAQHMIEITKYVLQVVKQQEIIPQPIIDPIEQGEANQKNSTFLSIQSYPPTFPQSDIAGTVPDETVENPPLQPFESAQSTAVSHEEGLRSPLTTKCEQPDGSLIHPSEGFSNPHLQSRQCDSSMVYEIGPYTIFDRFQSGPPETPSTGQTTYRTSSHIQDENSMSSLSSGKSEIYIITSP